MNILEIQNCTICYQNGRPAVSDVSLSVSEGEIVSIVGESGSGKTTLIRAILGLLPAGGRITGGSVLFNGRDLVKLREQELQDIRGREIAMIFQDVGAALDPIEKIKRQYAEAIAVHEKQPKQTYFERAIGMLQKMHLTDPKRVMDAYPFELSGGMKQRVGIAMGMTAQPKLLLADEPTSALDVTIQAQILELLEQLKEEMGLSILFISHDMRVVYQLCDRVMIMKDGTIVESGDVDTVYFSPQHEYTKELLEAAGIGEDEA